MLKAIKEGDEEALKAMIKAGKNLAEPNKEGWLPLHEAAYYGQLSCLKTLHQGEALGSVRSHRWGRTHRQGHSPCGALPHHHHGERGEAKLPPRSQS